MRNLALAVTLALSLSACGTLVDGVCYLHGLGDAFKPPSEVEKMGDAIQPLKVP